MSTLNFNWNFGMTDGTTKSVSSSIEDIIMNKDDISSCMINVSPKESSYSANIPLSMFSNICYGNISYSVSSGTIVSDLSSIGSTAFSNYMTSKPTDNKNYIPFLSNSVIKVNTAPSPTVDSFMYPGKYTFTEMGSAPNSMIIQIPVFSTDSSGNTLATNTSFTLYSGDSITIYGQTINSVFGYNILSQYKKNPSGNIVVSKDLSASGSSATLKLPIGVSFVYSNTGNGYYNCIVYPTGSTYLSNVDLRRNTLYGGGSTETYTIDNGSIPVAGVNIDSTVYGASNDYSQVLVSINGGDVWDVRYWTSAYNARFRVMAKKTLY